MNLALLVWLVAASGAADVTPDLVERQVAPAFPGWTVVRKASGDLNGDGVADLAVTLQKPAPGQGEDGRYKALLAVFLSGQGGKLRLHTRAGKAVCVGCGGPKAPFDEALGDLSISAKGVLVVTYEGGSREAWTSTYKWRHDAKTDRFLLIGETHQTFDTLAEDGKLEPGQVSEEDINYLSGKMLRRISKGGAQTCTVRPGLGAVELAKFDFEREGDTDKLVKGSCKRN